MIHYHSQKVALSSSVLPVICQFASRFRVFYRNALTIANGKTADSKPAKKTRCLIIKVRG
ncbi:hypothetical protein A0E43_07120 [Pectobacterium cacticida]